MQLLRPRKGGPVRCGPPRGRTLYSSGALRDAAGDAVLSGRQVPLGGDRARLRCHCRPYHRQRGGRHLSGVHQPVDRRAGPPDDFLPRAAAGPRLPRRRTPTHRRDDPARRARRGPHGHQRRGAPTRCCSPTPTNLWSRHSACTARNSSDRTGRAARDPPPSAPPADRCSLTQQPWQVSFLVCFHCGNCLISRDQPPTCSPCSRPWHSAAANCRTSCGGSAAGRPGRRPVASARPGR